MSDFSTGQTAYQALLADMCETAILASAGAVLGWDQETFLPPKGSALRADQLASLSGLVHERATRPQVEEWLAAAEADEDLGSDTDAAANMREWRRDLERARRPPPALVRELAQTTALAQRAWRDAREASDFSAFAPWLEKVMGLVREKAACYDPSPGRAYDVLLDEYEPGAQAGQLQRVFDDLRERLAPLIAEVVEARGAERDQLEGVVVPVPRQVEFNRLVLERIGFDLEAGRLDISTHPFCQGMGPGDTRLTTRFRDDDFLDALSSSLHEAGHGMYEQGLPKESRFGEPLSEAVSLGIHESQSRLWENNVGRSPAFWHWALPEARSTLGSALDGVSAEDIVRSANRVEPGLIRVDS